MRISFQQVKIACLQYDHTMQLFEGAVKIRRMLHPNQGDRTAEKLSAANVSPADSLNLEGRDL
jgi:hypothetical protein